MGTRRLVVATLALTLSVGHAATDGPTLRYDKPAGFAASSSDQLEMWIADGLDGVIHVYPFQPYQGDFEHEFRRALFRERIAAPYREDKLLAPPSFRTMVVSGAQTALAASFKNFNGGAPREHWRIAILAERRVALVDISANSPQAFERNRPSVTRLLNSLRVVGVGL